MEWFDILRYALTIICAVIAVFFPTFYARIRAARKAAEQVADAIAEKLVAEDEAQEAKAEARLATAELDLTETMQAAVDTTEQSYTVFDEMAKTKGLTCGAMKREAVLTKLQAYALEKGYTFDAEKWGAAIDAYVAATKRINYKK